ncbi:MAG: hypothetical protein RIB58_07065, partial [Phycisphaerales bacterium]
MIRYATTLAVLLLASLSAADGDCEPQRYTSPPGTSATHFGDSVASNGRFWFIGDSQASTPCPGGRCLTGAVHVYEMVDGRLELFQTLTPGLDGPSDFGAWIDVDGDRLAVGSWFGQLPGASGQGGGFIFDFDGDRWTQTGHLVPPPDYTGREGGVAVALSGDMAILSPWREREQWVYRETPDGWRVVDRLRSPDDLPINAAFGEAYFVQKEWIVTTAQFDSSRVRDGGSAYVFRRVADDEIVFAQKIEAPEVHPEMRFGIYSDIDDETLAISSYWAEREVLRQGAIFIYELEGDRWVFKQEINHQNPVENDRFGARLELRGDTLIAYVNSGNPATPQDNRVLVFRRGPDGLWRETGELVPNPPHRT